MRKVAALTAIVVGIIMAIAGVVTWYVVVSNTLERPEDHGLRRRQLCGRRRRERADLRVLPSGHHRPSHPGHHRRQDLRRAPAGRSEPCGRDGLRVPAGLAVHLGRRLRRRGHGVRPRNRPVPSSGLALRAPRTLDNLATAARSASVSRRTGALFGMRVHAQRHERTAAASLWRTVRDDSSRCSGTRGPRLSWLAPRTSSAESARRGDASS